MADYQKELDTNPDLEVRDRQDLEKLAGLQKDIAIGDSAEDFVRHPFFQSFENQMNRMIDDSKNKILEIKSVEELKAYQASIGAIKELKGWLNSHVMRGRIARQAIDQHERDTETMNLKIQEIVDKAQK